MSKCDLHIHSRFSARSEEWLFRRFDFPDSYSDPRELYRLARGAGMDFVTITDHDTIAGNLEIADLAGTFISAFLLGAAAGTLGESADGDDEPADAG